MIFVFALLMFLDDISGHKYLELKDVIKDLNRIHNFETISLFICDKLWLHADGLFPLLNTEEESSLKPKIIITSNFSSHIGMEHILSGSPLSLVLADNHKDNIIEEASVLLRGIRRNPIIFLMNRKPFLLKNNLELFCNWSMRTQFVNSMVMYRYSTERYGCEIFPEVELVDQTDWPTD